MDASIPPSGEIVGLVESESNTGQEAGREGKPPTSLRRADGGFNVILALASVAAAGIICIARAPCLLSMFQNEEKGFSSVALPFMDQLRFNIATISIEMMQNDTVEEAARSPFVDIGPFVDLVDMALDTVGIRGVYIELFETQQFAETITAAAKAKGLHDFYVEQHHTPETQPYFGYKGIPNKRNFSGHEYLCTGCLWWLRHWAACVTADKLLRDGSLRLDTSDNRLYDATSFMNELHVIQRSEHPDLVAFHAMHGFIWHYVTLTRPNLDEYPLDLAQDFCGDFLWKDEYVADVSDDIGRDCKHGFGHAVFYVLATHETSGYSVRKQFRPAVGFILSEDSMCEGYKICRGAPDQMILDECRGGMRHSYHLVGLNNRSDEARQALHKQQKHCEEQRQL